MMVTVRQRRVVLSVLLLALVAGCSREQQDWRSAEASDTIQGYDHFIERHPDSELTRQARTRVVQLTEDKDWEHAGSANTAEAYQQFLTQHPNGKWAQEARIRVESFALAAQPAATSSSAASASASAPPSSALSSQPDEPQSGTPRLRASQSGVPQQAAPQSPAGSQSPTGFQSSSAGSQSTAGPQSAASQPVLSAPAASPSGTNSGDFTAFGIQLGAFSSEAAATNQWQQLVGRFGSELNGLAPHVVTASTSSGTLYRLQSRVGAEARARAICDALKKQSQACVPVLPR